MQFYIPLPSLDIVIITILVGLLILCFKVTNHFIRTSARIAEQIILEFRLSLNENQDIALRLINLQQDNINRWRQATQNYRDRAHRREDELELANDRLARSTFNTESLLEYNRVLQEQINDLENTLNNLNLDDGNDRDEQQLGEGGDHPGPAPSRLPRPVQRG